MLILLFFPAGVTIESISQLGLSFFGLTYDLVPQAKISLFSQIHQIVFHGKGGYDWNTVYNMPVWLRKFIFNEIKKYYDEEKEAHEGKSKKGGSTTVIDSSGKIKAPEFLSKSQNSSKPIKYK
jgi:hypothetical protein